MSLEKKINADLKDAMRSKDKARLDALRSIKTAFSVSKAEKGSDGILTPDKELTIIKKLVKQRNDAAKIYGDNGRSELAEKELNEADFMSTYLPSMLTEEETELAVTSVITLVNAESIKDMGKVMGKLKKEYGARLDGAIASKVIKKELS